MPEEIKKGARHTFEVTKKQTDEINRKIEKMQPERGLIGALETGWMPDFYAYGEGAFARQFDGKSPMHIASELEPYFEGDLMQLVGNVNPYETFYFTPYDADFDQRRDAARRRYELAQREGRTAEGRGGYYGKKFGLKPMTRKRTTPFTVPKGATVRGIGPEDEGEVDVG